MMNRKKQFVSLIEQHFIDEPIITGKSSKNIFKNRYVRGLVYVVSCLCTTLLYYGWSDFQVILYREKAFEWLCTPDDLLSRETIEKACNDEQNARVQNLFTIATATEFSCAFIAGIITDRFGPLLTSFLGNITYILSWIILLLSGQSFPAYWLSMVLMGASVNMIAFPCLDLEEMFPSRRRLALSIIIAAQTGGSMIAPIMYAILQAHPTWSFSNLGIGYLLLIALPLFILSMLVHPIKRIAQMKEAKNKYATDTADSDQIQDYHVESPIKTTDDYDTAVTDYDMEAIANLKPKKNKKTGYLFEVAHEVLQLNYILFLAYFVLNIIAHGYYPTITNRNFHRNVSSFIGYFYPTQALWGVVIGYITDYTGTLIICEALCIGYILANILAVTTSTACHYISATIFIMSNAYIYSVKYTYLSENFPRRNFQTLVGIMGCIAGLSSLINLALEEVPSESTTILLSFAGIVGATIVLLITLQCRLKKSN